MIAGIYTKFIIDHGAYTKENGFDIQKVKRVGFLLFQSLSLLARLNIRTIKSLKIKMMRV